MGELKVSEPLRSKLFKAACLYENIDLYFWIMKKI